MQPSSSSLKVGQKAGSRSLFSYCHYHCYLELKELLRVFNISYYQFIHHQRLFYLCVIPPPHFFFTCLEKLIILLDS